MGSYILDIIESILIRSRMGSHDFGTILPKLRSIHRLARRLSSPTLIAARNTAFLAPYTKTPGGRGNFTKMAPTLSAIRVWIAIRSKWRTGAYDLRAIVPELRTIRRLASRLSFPTLIADKNTETPKPFTHTLPGRGAI